MKWNFPINRKNIPINRNTIKHIKFKVNGIFKALDPNEQIAIFCDPRGGSTWLAQTLKTIPQSFILNEPLHLTNFSKLRKLKFYWQQYIPENVEWKEAKEFLYKMQSGKTFSYALCSLNNTKELIDTQLFILKFIRGKALLPWYVKQFDLKYSPIFMIRHPIAMAASQMSHSAWNYQFGVFELPDSPYVDIYKLHLPFLSSLKTKAEQGIARWCIGNNIVLRNKANNKSWISVNYESMLLNPKDEFQKIFDRWNLNVPEDLMRNVTKASATTVNKKKIKVEEQLTNWKNFFSKQEIDRFLMILDYFEVDYYRLDPLPLIDAAKVSA